MKIITLSTKLCVLQFLKIIKQFSPVKITALHKTMSIEGMKKNTFLAFKIYNKDMIASS